MASSTNSVDFPLSIISALLQLESAVAWGSCVSRPLRNWCAVLLSSGVDPAWALRRRTGPLGLHCQLFLMSEESLNIVGLPGIYATMQRMCMLPAWRSQLLRTHMFPSRRRPPKTAKGTEIDESWPQVVWDNCGKWHQCMTIALI